jgi:hypothetical protein
VICETSIGESFSAMQFEWDVSTEDAGVTSLGWGWLPEAY